MFKTTFFCLCQFCKGDFNHSAPFSLFPQDGIRPAWKCWGTSNQEKRSRVTMEMAFLEKTMNFVNATHVNGRSHNNWSICWYCIRGLENWKDMGSYFFIECTWFCCSEGLLWEYLFRCTDEAPVLLSPKLACRWKYRWSTASMGCERRTNVWTGWRKWRKEARAQTLWALKPPSTLRKCQKHINVRFHQGLCLHFPLSCCC